MYDEMNNKKGEATPNAGNNPTNNQGGSNNGSKRPSSLYKEMSTGEENVPRSTPVAPISSSGGSSSAPINGGSTLQKSTPSSPDNGSNGVDSTRSTPVAPISSSGGGSSAPINGGSTLQEPIPSSPNSGSNGVDSTPRSHTSSTYKFWWCGIQVHL